MRARSWGLGLAATGILALVAGCSTEADADVDASESAVVDPNACPDGLVDLVVNKDEDWHLFTPKTASLCMAPGLPLTGGADQLERYLAKHPFAGLDKKPDFVAGCVQRWEASHRKALTPDQRSATVGNYYFLMNTLKQASLASLEAVAGLDMLLGNEPLRETKGVAYAHPYLHESSDWERRLREHCDVDPSRGEAMIQFTNGILWNARKISAALEAAGPELAQCGLPSSPACAEQRKRVEALHASKDALLTSGAPWLKGKEMKSLLSRKLDLASMVRAENQYDLVDTQGLVRPKSAWKGATDPKNPLVQQEAEVRAAFPKQLAATREVLLRRQSDMQKAADFLHRGQDAKLSAKEYQKIVDGLPPFDPAVFSTFYGSNETIDGIGKSVGALEAEIRKLGAALEGKGDTNQRLVEIELALPGLEARGADLTTLRPRVLDLRQQYDDTVRGLGAAAELGTAKCRNEVRSALGDANAAVDDFVIGAALTIGTAGLGSWLAVARAAVSAGASANVGLSWANAARVSTLAARGAQAVRGTVSYEKQAKILWGVLLGSNPYFIGDAAISSVVACNELIDDNMVRLFDVPFDLAEVQCLEGKKAMSRQVVANYKACATNVAINVALNAMAGYFAARDMRYGPLGKR